MLDAFGRLSRNWTIYSIIKERYFVNQQNYRDFFCSLIVQLLFLHSIICIAIYNGMKETRKDREKSLFRFHCAHSQMHQKCNSVTFFRGWALFRIGTIRVRLNQFALVAVETRIKPLPDWHRSCLLPAGTAWAYPSIVALKAKGSLPDQ